MGNRVAWEPEEYVRGNYFQSEINELFRKDLHVKLGGTILDVGCGDGQYTHRLAKNLKRGHILGIDSSVKMIQHAKEHWVSQNSSFEVHSIEEYQKPLVFDFVLSFWCLHWTNISLSFPNIFAALKPRGKVYAVFSSFSDNSILHTWRELIKSDKYNKEIDKYINLNYSNSSYFYNVINTLNHIPFTHVKLNLKTVRIPLPDIDYFKSLLLTMPFMKKIPKDLLDEFIEHMLIAFQRICQRQFNGDLYYETRPIFLEAIK